MTDNNSLQDENASATDVKREAIKAVFGSALNAPWMVTFKRRGYFNSLKATGKFMFYLPSILWGFLLSPFIQIFTSILKFVLFLFVTILYVFVVLIAGVLGFVSNLTEEDKERILNVIANKFHVTSSNTETKFELNTTDKE